MHEWGIRGKIIEGGNMASTGRWTADDLTPLGGAYLTSTWGGEHSNMKGWNQHEPFFGLRPENPINHGVTS